MNRGDLITLAILLDGEKPPSEFRIFRPGPNETTKGTFVFDAAAARAVMGAYEKHGTDMMIDLEHLSLDVDSPNFDPDARGWAKLEMRNGELWATDVKWTNDGAQRIEQKAQRYISPAFDFDPKSRRVTRILNMALTAMPATNDPQALIAASKAAQLAAYPWDQCIEDQMKRYGDKETAQKVCAAIKNQAQGSDRMDIGKVLAALGLNADASESDVYKRLAELADSGPPSSRRPPKMAARAEATALPAVPATDEGERAAFEVIARQAHADARMQQEIGSLREQQRISAVREILRSTDRYTSPAFESFALSKTPEEVGEYLRTLPMKPARLCEPRDAMRRSRAELTAADRKVGRMCGMDLKALAAHKAELAERDEEKQRRRSEAMMDEMEDM